MYPENISAVSPVPNGPDVAVPVPLTSFDFSSFSEELSITETEILYTTPETTEAEKFTQRD